MSGSHEALAVRMKAPSHAGRVHPLCVDRKTLRSLRNRLHRIRGQVSGIERMLREERSCDEILAQLASIREAANGLAAELLEAHIAHCVGAAIEKGDDRHAIHSVTGTVRRVLRHS